MTEPIEIYRQEGETARTIRVYIDHHGAVVVGSQDFPRPALRPLAAGGAGEYSYDTTVPAAEKGRLLLALLAERYQANPDAVEDFRDWCRAKGIPARFDTWGSDYSAP